MRHWLRTLKNRATNDERGELVSDVAFHDLRHDFAYRARASGWTVEEVGEKR